MPQVIHFDGATGDGTMVPAAGGSWLKALYRLSRYGGQVVLHLGS